MRVHIELVGAGEPAPALRLMSAIPPDLTLAHITGVDLRGDRLTLRVKGVRRQAVVFAGTVTFTGVSALVGVDERAPGASPTLTAGSTVLRMSRPEPNQTVLEINRPVGPGDADYHRFTITHHGTTVALRPSPLSTLRRWGL